jgi:adenosylcobinamide kinase/adenosylcobinamide-phosphate guanylyltransferase
MTIHLILGGARSGKSTYAQKSAELAASGRPLVMIATAEPFDAEMTARIAAHRVSRGPAWRTLEAPLQVGDAIVSLPPQSCAVLDCLTIWLSNVMLKEADIDSALHDLEGAAKTFEGDLWLVSNEVGNGLVPETPLGRAFRDASGRMNQRMAALADEVTLVIAGLPLTLKKASS